jgi:hypothetical protein
MIENYHGRVSAAVTDILSTTVSLQDFYEAVRNGMKITFDIRECGLTSIDMKCAFFARRFPCDVPIWQWQSEALTIRTRWFKLFSEIMFQPRYLIAVDSTVLLTMPNGDIISFTLEEQARFIWVASNISNETYMPLSLTPCILEYYGNQSHSE